MSMCCSPLTIRCKAGRRRIRLRCGSPPSRGAFASRWRFAKQNATIKSQNNQDRDLEQWRYTLLDSRSVNQLKSIGKVIVRFVRFEKSSLRICFKGENGKIFHYIIVNLCLIHLYMENGIFIKDNLYDFF